MKIIDVENKKELNELYKCSAITWEGLDISEDNLRAALKCCCIYGENGDIYITKGKTMNNICHLKGDNAYPDDLNIVSIKNYKGLAISVGARWMDDIIDNNARREKTTAKRIFADI